MPIETTLAQLESAQLVRRLSDEDLAYIFKHVFTQDAAYQSLLVKQRREIHRYVAQAYEQAYGDRCLDEFAALLAQHYAEAGELAKAFEYEIRAGESAMRVYAHAEAIVHYTQALSLGARYASPLQMQQLYLQRGRTYELMNRYEDALNNYTEMEAWAREHNDRPMQVAALIARTTVYSIPNRHFDIKLAEALSNQALELARAIDDQPAQAKILWNLMLLNTRLGTHYREAMDYGEQAIAIARALNLQEQLAYLLNDIGLLYVWDGQSERGKAVNLESRRMWRTWNNLPMLADNLSYVTMMHVSLGEYAQAIDTSREALQISQSIGNEWGESFSQSWVGQAHRELGEIAQAVTAMENAIRLAAQGFQPPLSFTRADLACLYGDMGQIARGIELAQQAHIEGERIAHVMLIWTAAQLAHLYLLEGNSVLAETIIHQTHQRLAPSDQSSMFGMGMVFVQAELAVAQKNYLHAIQTCDQLIEYQRTRHLKQYVPGALYLKSRALVAQGKIDEASVCLAEARHELETTSSRWTLWRVLAALAEIEAQRGNLDHAHTLRAQAREMIEFIAAHSPADLRASFLNLPAVRAIIHNE
jgi:tetratricopeptide (TPR) repeat protein